MRILVVGAGVVGSYYAWRLQSGGIEVHLAARGTRLAAVRKEGLGLRNYFSGRLETAEDIPAAPPEAWTAEGGEREFYDGVLICVQAHQTPGVIPLLQALPGVPFFVFLGNRPEGGGRLGDQLGAGRVLLGFGGIGGFREGQTVVYADSRGRDKPGWNRILLGPPREDAWTAEGKELYREAAGVFRQAGIRAVWEPRMDGWLKSHAALIAGLAGGFYSRGGDLSLLAGDAAAVKKTVQAVQEGLTLLKRRGYSIRPAKLAWMRRIPAGLLVPPLQRLFRSSFAEAGMAGHARAARTEMEGLMEFLRSEAAEAGISLPVLDSLWQEGARRLG